jgi:hypothetical protein
MGGQKSQFGRFDGQKNLLALPGEMSDKEAALKVNAEENQELVTYSTSLQ